MLEGVGHLVGKLRKVTSARVVNDACRIILCFQYLTH